MFWDSLVAGLKVLTYWQTYVAGLEYVAIFLIPMFFAGWFVERRSSVASGAVGCLSLIVVPIFQMAAMVVFALTLSPIIFGFAKVAAWSFPWKVITLDPGLFVRMLVVLSVTSFGMAFVPFLGRFRPFETLVLGGIALYFSLHLFGAIIPGGLRNDIQYIPDFWFVVGLVIIGGVMSLIGMLLAVLVVSYIGEGGELYVIPFAAILGFIPTFMYGTWLGAQVRAYPAFRF